MKNTFNRTVAVLTAVCTLFAAAATLSACGSSSDDKEEQSETQTLPAAMSEENDYILLTSDVTQAKPGDTVRVEFKLLPRKNVACFDMLFEYDPDVLTLAETEEGNIKDFHFLDNTGGKSPNSFRISGYTAKTVDFNDETVYTLIFTVNDGAAAGETAVTASSSLFQLGTDPSGAKTVDMAAKNDISTKLTLTVTE